MNYLKSHPWIKFSVSDLRLSDPKLCLQLGEIASKCEHLAGAPLRPEVAKELHEVYLAKGILATTAIEGNTLSEAQVKQQIEGSLKLPPSLKYLQQEVQNILDVCNEEVRLQTSEVGPKLQLCPTLIKGYNERVLHNLDVEEGTIPGQIRSHSVVVGNVYRGAPAQDCEYLLTRMCDWLNREFLPQEIDFRIPYAVLKAIVAHVYLAWIHPFGDGNGRTARLVEFHVLFNAGVPLPAAHLLSDHYNRTRTQYYRELDKASKSGGDLTSFVKYAIQGLLDGLREQIERVRAQQMIVMWENFVHGQFRPKHNSVTQKRRRDVALELPVTWVGLHDLKNQYHRIASLYVHEGDRVMQRDLNALAKMGLVERHYGWVRARRERMQGLLPTQVKDPKPHKAGQSKV